MTPKWNKMTNFTPAKLPCRLQKLSHFVLKSLLNLKITYVLFLSHFEVFLAKNNVPEPKSHFGPKMTCPKIGQNDQAPALLGQAPSEQRSKTTRICQKG